MRVLVTGHNGYIGSVLVPYLQREGHEVVGLDTYYFADCLFGNGYRDPLALHRDIRDVHADDLAGFDAVVHLAALSNDPMGELNAAWTEEINFLASVNLARAARNAGVKRFLFSSSCSMYGAADGAAPVHEDAPLKPLTCYAVSKVRTEEALAKLADADFSPVFLRNATAYGVSPHLRIDLVVNNLVGWAWIEQTVRIMSDGTPWRPLVHVEDIARAFAAILDAPREAVHNQAFNVGVNSENHQVRDLAEMVRLAVPDCKVTYATTASPDARSYIVAFDKIAAAVPAFQPQWTVPRGICELRDAYAHHNLSRADFEGRRYTRLKQLKHLLDAGSVDSTLRWQTP